MKPVTDPSLLAELDGAKPVTDPGLLSELEGDDYDFAAVERATAATPNAGRVSEAAPVVADADFTNVLAGATPGQGVAFDDGSDSFLSAIGDKVLALINAPARGLQRIGLGDSVRRGATRALASGAHAVSDFIDQTVQQANPLQTLAELASREDPRAAALAESLRDPLGAKALADQSLAVNREIGIDSAEAAQAIGDRPSLASFAEDPAAALEQFTAHIGNQAAESAPTMALALATRNPELAAGLLGASTGAQTYTDLRGQGAERIPALAAGAGTGAVEVAGEGLGLPFVMGKAGKGSLVKAILAEGAQEAPVQIAQQNIEDLATGKETPVSQQLSDALDAFLVGGALGGGGHVASNAPAVVADAAGRRIAIAPTPPDVAAELLAAAAARDQAVAPEPTADLDALLANITPEQVGAAMAALAPEPAPVVEPQPVQVDPNARFRRPEVSVQPETPPPAEPAAQAPTTGQPVQAPAAQSAPVSAGADLTDQPRAEAVTPPSPETPAANDAPAVEERRTDAIEQQRLNELRSLHRAGRISPEQSTELLDLAERDRVAAKVSGRRLRGVQTMEARNELETAGALKPVQAFADADNFKAVNDRLGHDVGDSVIRNMGELFAQHLGDGNVFHRGGDEFVLQADTPEQLDAAMTSVRDTLGRATLRATLEDGTVVEQQGVGFSYGAGSNIQEAERAQYQDKAARKRAGLRTDRDTAAGAVPDTGPVRGEPGSAGAEAGEGGTHPAQGRKAAAVTGTKNAVTDAERAYEGRDPIIREAARTNQETVDKAVQTLRDNPSRGAEVVERLRSQGVDGVSVDDEAVLLVHKADLRNKRDAAAKRASDESLPEEARAVAQHEYADLEGQIGAIDEAARASGREWGRLGQFRQRMLREDFTLESMERRLRAATGKPLTADQAAKIKELSEKVESLQRRADELQTKVEQSDSTIAYEDLLRAVQEAVAAPRKRPRLERLRAAADESRAALAALESVPSRKRQSGAAINPVAFYHLSRIGAYHVANGLTNLADWMARMRAELGERFDEFREMLPAVFQAAKEQAQTRADSGMSVGDVLAKIDPTKGPQPKDVRALAEAHIRAGLRGEQSVMEAVASSLDLPESDVRQLFVQSDAKRPQTRDEVVTELRDLRAVVRLQQEIERLEAGEPKPAKSGQREPPSKAVAEKRAELEKVRERLAEAEAARRDRRREQLEAQREAERPDEETRYQELRGRDIQRRIAELQDKIDRGDFAKKPRVPRALSAANEQAQFELAKAKEEFLRLQFIETLKNRSTFGKILGGVGDTLNLSRAVMTSMDLSGVFRQGGFITFGHPVRAAKSLVPMLRAFSSARAEHVVMNEIESRPNAPLYRRYGLELTGVGSGTLNKIEEAYASRWLDRVPPVNGQPIRNLLRGGKNIALAPVRGSGRAYVTFLNKLRADSFDAMAATLALGATPTEAEGKAIANYINVATGRGPIGSKKADAGKVLNTVIFAPRLVASRFQLLVGQPLYGGSARTRKLIAQEYARFLIGVGVVMSLAAYSLAGDDDDEPLQLIGLDPRSSNFGKIKFGETYLDPLAGLAQVTVLLARLSTGETVNGSGKVKPLRPDYTLTDLRRALGDDIPGHKLDKEGGLPFGSGSSADVIGRFLRTKLAPVPGAIVNALTGSNVIGEEVSPLQVAQELVTPMSFQNIGDIMEEQGIAKGTAITLLGILGMGVQHRGSDEAKESKNALASVDAAKSDIEDRLAAMPVDQWESALAKMKQEYTPLLDGVELDVYERDGKYGNTGEPRMTKDGKPVLSFQGKDGAGSVMGELEGYPGFGPKGPYTTAGSQDRIKSLNQTINVLGGDSELTRAAAVRLTERMQLQVPAAQELFDAVQAANDGGTKIDRKTRDRLLQQVRFLRSAEERAEAELVKSAKDGKPPAYNTARELVQKAVDEKYGGR